MNFTASRLSVLAISVSVHRAERPPAMKPMRLMPLTIVSACPCLGFGFITEQFRMLAAGRLVAHLVAVADLDRIGRIETLDLVVPHEDARHAIAGRRKEEGVIEAQFERAGLDHRIVIEVAAAEPQMPFAHLPRRIAGFFQERGDGRLRGVDGKRGLAAEDMIALGVAEGVLAGDERIAGWRADRGRGVGVGEADAFAGELIDVRRLDLGRAIAAEIAVADVVGQDEDDVGRSRRGTSSFCIGDSGLSVLSPSAKACRTKGKEPGRRWTQAV